MASLDELVLKAGDLRNVRLADYISKRSSAFTHGWNIRYTVLSGNFLFVYSTPQDNKPRRVICVDDCTIDKCERFPKKPHAFYLSTPKGKEYYFACENAEICTKWITSIRNAGYTNMYQRTKEAVKFLERCKELVAPFVVALHTANNDKSTSPSSSSSATPFPPALRADQSTVQDEDINTTKAAMTGADVLQALSELKEAQNLATVTLRDQSNRLGELEKESIILRDETDRAKRAAADVAALRSRVDELTARNSELQVRTDALNRDLTLSMQAAAKATRLVAGTNGNSTSSGNKSNEEDLLRARIRELEASNAREREELLAQIRNAQANATSNNGPATSNTNGPNPATLASPSSTNPNKTVNTPANITNADPSVVYEHEWQPFLSEAQRLEREGNFTDAEQQYEAVLETKSERCGAESVTVASACRDLGRVLALQRRFDKAELHYSRAVKLCSKLLGENHPNTACALTDLAAVLREQSKFKEAEIYAIRAVNSLKISVGADDVSTATALYNLAGLAKRQGKFQAAEEAYGEALRIFKDKLGDGQGETADTLYQMGCLYRKRNEITLASTFFQQAADAYGKTYGPNDKRVIEASKRAKNMMDKSSSSGNPTAAAATTGSGSGSIATKA